MSAGNFLSGIVLYGNDLPSKAVRPAVILLQGAAHGAFTRGAAQHTIGCGGRRLYSAFLYRCARVGFVPTLRLRHCAGRRFVSIMRRNDGSCIVCVRQFRGGRRIRSVVSVGRFAGLRLVGRHFRFRSERGGVVCAGGTHRGRCVPEEEARRCVRKIHSKQSDFHVGVNQDAM